MTHRKVYDAEFKAVQESHEPGPTNRGTASILARSLQLAEC